MPHDNEFTQAKFLADPAADFPAHKVAVHVGHVPFPVRGIKPEQFFCDHQRQNPVTQEFQALIVIVFAVGAAMGERMAQQNGVFEMIAKTLCDLFLPRL